MYIIYNIIYICIYIYYIDTISLLHLFDYFQYNFSIKNFLKIVIYNDIKKLYIHIHQYYI